MTAMPLLEIIDRSLAGGSPSLITACCQDCACAISTPTPSRITSGELDFSVQHPYVQAPGLRVEPLVQGYWSIFNPEAESGVVVLNERACQLLYCFETPILPSIVLNTRDGPGEEIRGALTRLISLDLIQRPGKMRYPLTESSKLLTAWLHVTNQCNLRCTYCYLHKTSEVMPQNTARSAVDAMVRSAVAEGYSAIKLKYAGGEPLLRIDQVFSIHNYALARCQANSIELQAVILSNGTLLNVATIEGLRTRKVGVMISLDGLGQTHDVQRPYPNGRGSTEQIIAGIERLVEHGLSPHLSITITNHNCQSVDQAIRFALSHNLTFSLNFYRESDCSAASTDLRCEDRKLIAGMETAFRAIEENLPPWSVVGTSLDRGQLISPHQRACGVASDYMAIDHHGRISKCQMQMDMPVTTVQDPNPLKAVRNSPSIGVQNPSSLDKEGCQDCEWRYWCAGGCPLLTYRVTGRYDLKSPYCDIYKAIYPKAIRLEGLRSLKYANKARVTQESKTSVY